MATQIFLVILNNETRSFNIGPFSVATDSHEILLIMRDTKKYVPAEIYLFKVNNGNTRKIFKRCQNLAITTPERRHEFKQNSRLEYEFFKPGQIDQQKRCYVEQGEFQRSCPKQDKKQQSIGIKYFYSNKFFGFQYKKRHMYFP